MTANVPAPLFDAKQILDSYLEGKSTDEVAVELGTSREKLVYWLTKNAEEDWKMAQFLKAINLKDKANAQLSSAEDLFQLRQAEAMLKSAQWDLERVCRRIYGDDSPKDDQRERVSIIIAIDRSEEKDITPEPMCACQKKLEWCNFAKAQSECPG